MMEKRGVIDENTPDEHTAGPQEKMAEDKSAADRLEAHPITRLNAASVEANDRAKR